MTQAPLRALLTALLLFLAGCVFYPEGISGEMTVRFYFSGHSSVPATVRWALYELSEEDNASEEIESGNQDDLTVYESSPALDFSSLTPGVYGVQIEAAEDGQSWFGTCLLPLDRFREIHDCSIPIIEATE